MLDWRIATVIAVLVSRDWKLEWSLSSGPWEVQTSTRAGLGFRAGVKDYRLTYLQGYRYGLTCRFPSLEYHLRAATPWIRGPLAHAVRDAHFAHLPPVPILGAVHARDLDLGSGKLLPTAFAVAVLTTTYL